MRQAELIVAGLLALFSLYLMYLAQLAPLQIGWVPKKGPGSGAFPFWLSAGMLVCAIAIFVRGWRGVSVQGRSSEAFMSSQTLRMVIVTTGSIFTLLAVTHWLGAYVAIFLFLLFYIGVIGRHSWMTTIAISVLAPVVIFFFFESGMKILLPKGATEPLFLPLYRIFVY